MATSRKKHGKPVSTYREALRNADGKIIGWNIYGESAGRDWTYHPTKGWRSRSSRKVALPVQASPLVAWFHSFLAARFGRAV